MLHESLMRSTPRVRLSHEARYAQLRADMWKGHRVPGFRGLSPNAKVLYLYLASSPLSNLIGVYYLPWEIAALETGLTQAEINEALAELEPDLVTRDGETMEVAVLDSLLLMQSKPLAEGDKRTKHAWTAIAQVKSARLREAWLTRNAERLPPLPGGGAPPQED
jgi:hypothetical protein